VGSAEKAVEVDLQANPQILSDINEKSFIKFIFYFSEDTKSISTSGITFCMPRELNIDTNSIIFNNLNKRHISMPFSNSSSKEYRLLFNTNNIEKDKEYSIEFPLACDAFGEYILNINSAKFLDISDNNITVDLNRNSIKLKWGPVVSCIDEDCEDQNGPFGEPYKLNNIIYQKTKKGCHCDNGDCSCNDETKICDIEDLCRYISVEPPISYSRENITLRADFSELCNEMSLQNISISYLTDENTSYFRTWNNVCFIEQEINNLSLGSQDINIKCNFDFYPNINREKSCQKPVTVNILPGLDAYLYILPTRVAIGEEIQAEIWCINNIDHPIYNINLSFKLPDSFDKKAIVADFPKIPPNGHDRKKYKIKGVLKGNYIIKEYGYNYTCFNATFNGDKVIMNEASIEIFEPPTLLDNLIASLITFISGVIIGIFANAIYGFVSGLLR
jgi:hypothetical protein